MRKTMVEVDIECTPLVSIDGIGEFTDPLGSFSREYKDDAKPLIEWGERTKAYIADLRRQFGESLWHVAVVSRYKYRQFHYEQGWRADDDSHPLDSLCVDATYRDVTIDHAGAIQTTIEKNGNDAMTSAGFQSIMQTKNTKILIGVTTTHCIALTLSSVLSAIDRGDIPLQTIVIAANGVASRKSRRKDERTILDGLAKDDRIIIVPKLADIRWVVKT